METKYISPGKPRVSGGIFRAPAGTTLPADAKTVLDNAFVNLGYVSEDGISNSNIAEITEVYAWGGNSVMNSVNRKPDTWVFTLLEALSPNVLKTVYGDKNVTVSADGKSINIMATADDAEEAVYAIDMALSGGALKRIVIPKGVISNVAEIVYKDNSPIGYKITVNALYDANGKSHYEHIQLAEE